MQVSLSGPPQQQPDDLIDLASGRVKERVHRERPLSTFTTVGTSAASSMKCVEPTHADLNFTWSGVSALRLADFAPSFTSNRKFMPAMPTSRSGQPAPTLAKDSTEHPQARNAATTVL
jgi:hypothetical protein